MSKAADPLQDNDTRLVAFLSTLSADQWERPSLCTDWSNHEVLAHLVVGYSATLPSIAAAMLRHRGSFDRTNSSMARALAAQRDPHSLIDDFAALTRQARGIGRLFPRRLLLGDHVIHQLDITFALGAESTIPPTILAAVLDTEVRIPNPFVPASARARGLNLIATDTTWSRPSAGPTATGEAGHLASVLAGRPWALRHLTGDGVSVLATRLQPSRKSIPLRP
ncbi:hypothetical protein A9X05_21800 [Mycobacterium sp. E3298]|uniref:maleylpyruvate isomerase family mycothiol-dependent enzyme n=1 Tax=unclassified Mycobacterium TaxID=2642494 RepID=UPI0008017937|nr:MULTISPECIES: maleylpyruvate isomerase family mycothiol-dependent enzyme [unclassified Mycobacterium]OBG60549.1 hypothetical protein A5703_24310 [Mycobacterium sp. E188]OBG79763.1 hypothetical protein A9X05_21800 [Mycobacterium sp. E3298]OBH35031.1 hypothetical protein A5691_06985 [Mycobacterium sp. E183]